jgi:hypothetical protein
MWFTQSCITILAVNSRKNDLNLLQSRIVYMPLVNKRVNFMSSIVLLLEVLKRSRSILS